MPSRMTLQLIDFARRSTELSLVGPDYAADGSDYQSQNTLWDNLRLAIEGITTGTEAAYEVAGVYMAPTNPATPDSGAQRKQEWVFRYNVPAIGKEFIVSIGTADTDNNDAPVVVSNGRTILDPGSAEFTSLKTAWDAVVKYDNGGTLEDTEFVGAEFRTVR